MNIEVLKQEVKSYDDGYILDDIKHLGINNKVKLILINGQKEINERIVTCINVGDFTVNIMEEADEKSFDKITKSSLDVMEDGRLFLEVNTNRISCALICDDMEID